MHLVTGGAGFIGSNIAAALAERGADVVVCDWLGTGGKWQNLAGVRLHDLVLPEDLAPWLAVHARDLAGIVHMGAVSATGETDADKLVRHNIQLSLRLWAVAAAQQVPFVYASSAATYGDGSRGFADDASPEALALLRPLNPYAWSKHVVDCRFIADVEAGRPQPAQWAGLKLFNVYGPNEAHKGDMRSVVHKVYPKVAAGEAVELFRSHDPRYDDGGQMRDFVYVKDCVAAVLRLLDSAGVSGLFNLGTGKARSFRDLVLAVGRAAGREPRIRYIDMPEEMRGRYQYFTQADMRKLASAIGWSPIHALEDGVSDYVSRHLAR
jgi:ADP-L-glycero-D-manno-heptose 6-epimerase